MNDGFPCDRIEVIPNGVELEDFEPTLTRETARRAAGLPLDARLIVSIARFHPVKDHATLLRAFAFLASRHATARLVLAGEGPLRSSLESLAAELGVTDRVDFLGVRSDVPALLRASDVFCLTSLSEAASLTVLEAMAAGVPIVLTDVGGNSELVRDGVEGLLVPRGDPAAVAAALNKVLSDDRLAVRLAEAAAARVRERYPLSATIGRYFELYSELAA
jgi:glycosyltransferase involved in cell wall biosynthesis